MKKKDYRVILKSAITTLSFLENIKTINSQYDDIIKWENINNLAR